MVKRIKAIFLLLSFLMVLVHMMVPHHHHESSWPKSSNWQHQQVSHTHEHNGVHHHHHDEEPTDEDATDHKLPLHLHFSADGEVDFLRIHTASLDDHQSAIQEITAFNTADFFLNDPLFRRSYFHPDFGFLVKNQTKPGANGLRGPPSIA